MNNYFVSKDVAVEVAIDVFAKAPYCLGGGGGECEPSG